VLDTFRATTGDVAEREQHGEGDALPEPTTTLRSGRRESGSQAIRGACSTLKRSAPPGTDAYRGERLRIITVTPDIPNAQEISMSPP